MVGWKPKAEFDRGEAVRLVRTGAGILFGKLAGNVNKRLVDGITGAVLGLAQLGSFRLGWRFFDFIVQFSVTPLSAVALSTFSTIQHDTEKLKRAYLRLTQFVSLGSFPAFFGLGAVADLAIPTILGDKWQDSIIVMQLLGFVMLGGVVNYFFGSALIAIGRVNVMVRQSTAQIVATAILVLIGAQFGIVGVIVAVIARAALVAVYNMAVLRREIGLAPSDFVRALIPPIVASGLMVAAVRFAMLELQGAMPNFVLLIVLIAIGAAAYGAALVIGDFAGLWRGYLRSAASSVAGAFNRRSASPKPA
jgi:O-antigen/teichoic acid export membrane protein